MKTPRLAFALKDFGAHERPLAEVFQEALDVINSIGDRPGELVPDIWKDSPTATPNWLARIAIRAVSEAIVTKGIVPLPLAVEMHWRGSPGSGEDLPCTLLPESFRRLAAKHGVNPRFLAAVAMEDYEDRHREAVALRFRTGYPLDERKVIGG